MKEIHINILAVCLISVVLLSACSVTKHLPEGEVLYTGSKTVILNKSTTPVGETALTEIDAALDKTPSTKMFGGILPIPFKMWMYNDFVKYKKGFGKWMFNRFAANPPVFISTVNPEVRVKVTTNLLRDYGYFNGKLTKVSPRIIPAIAVSRCCIMRRWNNMRSLILEFVFGELLPCWDFTVLPVISCSRVFSVF